MFSILVMDEAHQVRNTDTAQHRTMLSMRGEFNVLLTATPSFNTIDDLKE
jgi:SNF2 family DNA or RNA helicase